MLFGSCPYLPLPAAGMTGPSCVEPADVVAPPAVVAAPAAAVEAVAAAVLAVVVAAAPPLLLLSPPHAAATMPTDTSRVVGTTHRCFFIRSPWWLLLSGRSRSVR